MPAPWCCSRLAAFTFETRVIHWSGELVFAIAWLVLVLSIAGVGLMYWLIRRSAATGFASLFYLVPVVTALFAYLLFGEKLDALSIAGMVVCAAGVVLVNRGTAKPAPMRRLARQKFLQRVRLHDVAAFGGRKFCSKFFEPVTVERHVHVFRDDLVIGPGEDFRRGIAAANDNKPRRWAIERRNAQIGPIVAQYRQQLPYVAGPPDARMTVGAAVVIKFAVGDLGIDRVAIVQSQ